MFSTSFSSMATASSSSSRPTSGQRRRKQSKPRPRTAPVPTPTTMIDEPVLYPPPRTAADLRSQRKRQTTYVIPGPMDYTISTRLTQTRSPVATVGLEERSPSYWHPDSNPPVGLYDISGKDLVASSIRMHPRQRHRRGRNRVKCLEDIAAEIGVGEKSIEQYMALSGNRMTQEAVDILQEYIKKHPSEMYMYMDHEMENAWFSSNNSEYNERVSLNKPPDRAMRMYVHGLLRMFLNKLDVQPPLYAIKYPVSRYGSRFCNGRPKSGQFTVCVEDGEEHDVDKHQQVSQDVDGHKRTSPADAMASRQGPLARNLQGRDHLRKQQRSQQY